MSDEKKPIRDRVWFKRAVYLILAIACYPAMSFTIQVISDVSGLTQWSQQHGPYFILNEFTGPIVMTNFFVILFFIALSMAFIFKAFGATEELPID
ncbi:MAG: hypothetical protein ACP6KW_04955 [Candidatus Thorarchaeota archaeon]